MDRKPDSDFTVLELVGERRFACGLKNLELLGILESVPYSLVLKEAENVHGMVKILQNLMAWIDFVRETHEKKTNKRPDQLKQIVVEIERFFKKSDPTSMGIQIFEEIKKGKKDAIHYELEREFYKIFDGVSSLKKAAGM